MLHRVVLMQVPQFARRCMISGVRAFEASGPVVVAVRIGWEGEHENAPA